MMIIYDKDIYYNQLTKDELEKLFYRFDIFNRKTISFEVNFKLSKGMYYKKEYRDEIYKKNYYEKVIKIIKKDFYEKKYVYDERLSKVYINSIYKIKNNFDKTKFLKNLYNMFEFVLFEDFLNKNSYYNTIYIEELFYVHILLASKFRKNIITNKVSHKNKSIAINLGVSLYDKSQEVKTINRKLNNERFKVIPINDFGKKNLIDLRQYYMYSSFYICPKLLKQVINIKNKGSMIILPLFYNTNSKLFSSENHGSYKIIIEYEYFIKSIFEEIINVTDEVIFFIPNLLNINDYLFVIKYFETYKEEYPNKKLKIGILIDDIEMIHEINTCVEENLDEVMVSIDKIINNNFYSDLNEYEEFSTELLLGLREIRQVLRKKNVDQTIRVMKKMSEYNLEKLMILGYRNYILSHNNTYNYLKSSNNFMERRGKYTSVNKRVAK